MTGKKQDYLEDAKSVSGPCGLSDVDFIVSPRGGRTDNWGRGRNRVYCLTPHVRGICHSVCVSAIIVSSPSISAANRNEMREFASGIDPVKVKDCTEQGNKSTSLPRRIQSLGERLCRDVSSSPFSRGCLLHPIPGKLWARVVPSPMPLSVLRNEVMADTLRQKQQEGR